MLGGHLGATAALGSRKVKFAFVWRTMWPPADEKMSNIHALQIYGIQLFSLESQTDVIKAIQCVLCDYCLATPDFWLTRSGDVQYPCKSPWVSKDYRALRSSG